jgi:hypothetical protein
VSQPTEYAGRAIPTPAIILPTAAINTDGRILPLKVAVVFVHCNLSNCFHIFKIFKMRLAIQITIRTFARPGALIS